MVRSLKGEGMGTRDKLVLPGVGGVLYKCQVILRGGKRAGQNINWFQIEKRVH